MGKFWEVYTLTQSNKKETKNLHLTIISKETELVISYNHERHDPDDFTGEFYLIFKEQVILVFYK